MLCSFMNYGWGRPWGVGAPPGYTDGATLQPPLCIYAGVWLRKAGAGFVLT